MDQQEAIRTLEGFLRSSNAIQRRLVEESARLQESLLEEIKRGQDEFFSVLYELAGGQVSREDRSPEKRVESLPKDEYALSTEEVSEYIGIRPAYLRVLIKSGKIPASKRFLGSERYVYRLRPSDVIPLKEKGDELSREALRIMSSLHSRRQRAAAEKGEGGSHKEADLRRSMNLA